MNDNLLSALAFARRGFAVLPLHTIDENGCCTCGKPECRDAGKHPIGALTPRGLTNASRDAAVIQAWLTAQPRTNLGMRTDELLIIDIDPRNSGDETLAVLEHEHGPFPPTWVSITGGGGLHIWTARPAAAQIKSRNAFRPGIDIKTGAGAYIVVPPSLHKSGAHYRWRDGSHPADIPLASPPSWLLQELTPPPAPPSRPWRPRSNDDQCIRNALMSIPVDGMSRRDWLRIGMALHAHFGAAGLRLWDEWSRKSEHYDRAGLVKAWKSFKGSGVTVATIFHYAREAGRAA